MRKILLDCFEGIPLDRLLPMAKEAGFDGIYTSWRVIDDLETMRQLRHLADKLGLEYENAHATIPGTGFLWSPIPEGDACAETLLGNLKNCAAVGVPMTVVHVAPRADADFALGICRMARIVEAAEKLGVQVAFENCHDASFLIRTLEYFAGADCVGFCYDSGHEACRGYGYEFLPLVGDRLICTHIHDNDMVDDLHLIPFDGKIDWPRVMRQLKECHYKGPLTLELRYGKFYEGIPETDFLQKSFEAVKRLRDMMK